MKKWTSLFLLICVILSTGCQNSQEKSVPTEAEFKIPKPSENQTVISSEIPLHDILPEFLAYNMADNSLSLICRLENEYTLYYLYADSIHSPNIHWHIPKGYTLDNFVYGTDGSFYAVLKHYDKKGNTCQTVVSLKKNGTYKTVPLKDINKVPDTKMDSYLKKKKKKSDHSITDIQFSGTALAITYSNYAVKFYNISEGMPLGDNGITGTPGQNVFYEHLFIMTGLTYGRQDVLNYIDIRNGEKQNSIEIDDILYVTNYREKLYILTKDRILHNQAATKTFREAANIHGLTLPQKTQNLKLFATRNDILYLFVQNHKGTPHLYRIPLIL